MPDMMELFGQTTGVMTELLGRAQEAAAAGASRREFFAKTAVLAGASTLGAAGVGLLQPIAAHAATANDETTPDTLAFILNVAATAEALGTTFYYYGLSSSHLPNLHSNANLNYFQAAVVQEYEHMKILEKLGAAPLVTQFYFPDGMFTDQRVFFLVASTLENYFISAYIAAAREFSGAVSKGIPTADPTAIGLAVQIGGIECEHRALLRVAANQNPPNNRIIESALLKRVSDAVAPLTPFLQGGKAFQGPYSLPSRSEVNAIAQPYGFSSFPPFKIF